MLSGDFLLARASVALAKLRRTQVVREMASYFNPHYSLLTTHSSPLATHYSLVTPY